MNLDTQIFEIALLEGRDGSTPSADGRVTRHCKRESYNLEVTQVTAGDGVLIGTIVQHRGIVVYASSTPAPLGDRRETFVDGSWTQDIATWHDIVLYKQKNRVS